MTTSAMSRRQFCIRTVTAVFGALGAGAALASSDALAASDDVIPWSSTSIISSSDIAGMDAWTLCIARNEIYARHGYAFTRSDLANYFAGKSWYRALYAPGVSVDAQLSYTEQRNIAIILERERAIGSPYISGGSGGSSTGGYVFPQSSSAYLSKSDLSGLSTWQLYIARNEIYARHGYGFQRRDLANYFAGQSWYTRRYAPGVSVDSQLNAYESANIALILSYERSIGSQYL